VGKRTGDAAGGRPKAAELHAGVAERANAPLELSLDHIVVPTTTPAAVGALLTVQLRVSKHGPTVPTLARVARVEPPTAAGEPSLMRLSLLDVWGSAAIEQLMQYLTEANRGAANDVRYRSHVRVLIVDDQREYRERAATVMSEAGFEVLCANDGIEGLSVALKHQPSLILSDVHMPGMDGWQLLRMIRARPTLRRIPVIFFSSMADEEQRLRGYQLGVDDYVSKPFTEVELIARVERVLERARMTDDGSNDMRGTLAKISVTSLLSFAELERRTGVLQLERDGERATVHLRDGAIMRIDLGAPFDRLTGIERVFHVLDWTDGHFELTSADVFADDTLKVSTSYALIEHARRVDESAT
jgi:DNA-binding response OmpR family regulator